MATRTLSALNAFVNALKGRVDSIDDRLDVVEVAVKALLAASGGSGGTTPIPNDPPPPTPDITAPNFTATAFGTPTQTTIGFTWTTDEAAKVRARYGTSTAMTSATALSGSFATSGGDTITGLVAGTTYYIALEAQDADGNIRLGSVRQITTQAVPVPPPGTSVTVNSVSGLLAALKNNTVTEIVVADGTYHVSTAATQSADSLWIGSAYAGRTNPVTVRAATTGGVIFDGTGEGTGGLLSFEDGAHHQTWEGFKFANIDPTGTGCIVFGGYPGLRVPCHHITLNDCTIMASVTPPAGTLRGHAVYFSWSGSPGGHDVVIDGMTVDNPSKRLMSACHFYHGPQSGNDGPNYSNVSLTNWTVNGTDQAFLIWEATTTGLLIQDALVTGAARFGVRYEFGTVTLRRVTTVSSGVQGFFSNSGPTPAGVTFDSCTFDA